MYIGMCVCVSGDLWYMPEIYLNSNKLIKINIWLFLIIIIIIII